VTLRVAIRGFVRGQKIFEDRLDLDPEEMDQLLPELAKKHSDKMLTYELHVIEMEFLDEPDQMQRYFRFGTDKSGMVRPIKINGPGGTQ
jgi:hypothetical protein